MRARRRDDRLRRDRRRIPAAHAVEKNSRTRDVPRRRPAMLDRRAVLGVDHRRTHRKRGERVGEPPLLLDARVVVRARRNESA